MRDGAFPTDAVRLPSDWTLVPFDECCERVVDNLKPAACKGKPYVGLEHLQAGFPALVGVGSGSNITSAKTGFRSNDILFGKLRPYLRKGLRVTFDGVCSTDILAFRPKHSVRSDFLGYLIHTDPFVQQAIRTTSGVNHPRTSWYGLRKFLILRPPLDVQQQIATVLRAVQRAIERQERLIALTDELKKALTHKLFTEGTRGEPLQQTEIGPVPASWKVEPLGKLFSREPSNGLYRPQSDYGRGTPILRIDDFSNDGDIVSSASNLVDVGAADLERFGLAKDDIVLNRVNSISHLGKTALISDLDEPMLFESNMMRFRVDERRLRPSFAFRLLNSTVCKLQIIGLAKRAVAQSSVNQGDVSGLLLPLPSDLATQDEILTILNALETKRTVHAGMRASLHSLFRTLLHQLMTAKIRVNGLDLSAVEGVEAVGAA